MFPSAVKIFIAFDDSHLSTDSSSLGVFVRHYETRKTAMYLSKCWLFVIFYPCPAVRDPLPNCKRRTPFLEICIFVLFVGEWSLIGAKWESYVTIVSLDILFSNIADIKHALPLNLHMRRFRKEKLILLLFI
jgi:hypothetical protein